MAHTSNNIYNPGSGMSILINLGMLVIHGCVLFFMLKAEVHDNKTNYEADKRILDYRMASLEDCCNGKVAIKPKELKFERYGH